jgi:translocation and assembly module TamA
LLAIALLALPGRLSAADAVTVNITGLDEPLEKNVRAMLTMARQTADARKEAIDLAAARAPDEIRSALQPFGYYRPKISATLNRHKNNCVAAYRIDPGPPILLSRVEVKLDGEATQEPDMRVLVDKFPLQPGAVLDHVLYEKGRNALQEQAAEMGFFDARFTAREVRVDLQSYQARITLRMESGRRYRFGDLSFTTTPLEPELLERFARFKPGEPYRASAVLAMQKSLLNSGYFAQADIVPRPDQAKDGRMPVAVDLVMVPRNRIDLGGGYGTDTGPRLSLVYRNRYLNSYGHTFQASAKLSLIWNQIAAIYAIPLADPERDQLAFTTKLGIEDTVAGRAKVIRGGIRHGTTRWDLREVLSIDFLRETFNIGYGYQTTDLLIPSVNYTWLSSDDAIYPRQGIRIDGNLAGSLEGAGSQVSFARLRLYSKGVYSLNDDNRLIARGQFGSMVTNDFDRMPITERFYAGGAPTVRGYRLFEISPTNALGTRTGGRHLAVASLEYDRSLFGDWGMAVFSDLGYVGNDFNSPVRTGVGLGARWRSPVGPVRLDVGVPLSQALDPVQVYLILGPDL